jgi:deoxyribonuclease-1-like protein
MRTLASLFIAISFVLSGCAQSNDPSTSPKTYTISITPPSNGMIALSPEKATYSYGESVTATASPLSGYSFTSWGGSLSGSTNPSIFTISGDMTISAVFSVLPGSTTPLRIGSFNIEIFGPTKESRENTLSVLAQIATTFDVLAIEEVGSNASTALESTCITVMDTYVARINQIVGSDAYAYVRGNQYGIVYKKDKFRSVSSALYSGTQSFSYTPLTAYFRTISGNLDFSMLVIHTSPSLAVSEIPALKVAMGEVSTQYSEPDVICLGDFNADGSYYTEGTGTDLSGFDSSSYISAIPNSFDTTVASSANTYDRIELSSSMASDYTSSSGVIQIGQVYDVTVCEGTATTAGTESAVSDHYPVWAEFYVDRDTD